MRRFQPRISLGSRARVQARQANLVDHNERHKLKEQQFAGKTIPYLPIFVRAEGKHIALAEIMIEPNQNAKEVHERLKDSWDQQLQGRFSRVSGDQCFDALALDLSRMMAGPPRMEKMGRFAM